MNKKDKQIVKKVGCTMENVYACYTRDIEEYTELIRADENKACAKHYLEIMRDAVEQAVLREREACAKLCEEENWSHAMGNIIRSERGVA